MSSPRAVVYDPSVADYRATSPYERGGIWQFGPDRTIGHGNLARARL